MPDYSDIFGSADYCACGHCRSVLGPAAYLTDLLQWLADRRTLDDSMSLRDVLIGEYDASTGLLAAGGRRPDLAHLALSCENSDRALPYIDLVLEVLENAVGDGTGDGSVDEDAAHDSAAETPSMLATPQYVSATAYTTLAAAHNCLDLPFNQPLEEARTFLAHLGVSRARLVEAFRPVGGSATLSAVHRREVLGLDNGSYTEVCRVLSGTEDAEDEFWSLPLYVSTPGSWLAEISNIESFRRATRLSWPEIQDLVHARYVNPRTWSTSLYTPQFQVLVSGDPCSLANYAFVPYGASSGALTLSQVARIRQFVRLHRATGWSQLVLDKVLSALGVTDLSTATPEAPPSWLRLLAEVRRIELLTGEDPVAIACWRASEMDTWDDRDTRESPVLSLYTRVYLNPAVLPEEDERRADWELVDPSGAGPELAGASTATLGDHTDLLAGALGLSGDVLDDAIAALGLSDGSPLTLQNVTTLFKWASVGRACRLTPADAYWLAGSASLFSSGAFVDDGGIELVELARSLEARGWTIEEMRYVVTSERERAAVTDDFLQAALGRVRDALTSTYEALDATITEASLRELVAKLVAEELGVDRGTLDSLRRLTWASDPLEAATSTTFTFTEDTSVVLVGPQTLTLPVGWTGTVSISGTPTQVWLATSSQTVTLAAGTTVSVPQGQFWTGSSPAAAQLASGVPFTLPKGATVTLPGGTTYVTVNGTPGTLSSATSCTTGVDTDGTTTAGLNVSFTFETFAFQQAAGEPDLLAWLLREPFRVVGVTSAGEPWSDLTRASHATDFAIFDALAKVCFVVKKLGLDEEERDYWIEASTSTPALWGIPTPVDLDPQASPVSATEVEALIRLFACRARIPGDAPTFVEILRAAVTTSGSAVANDEDAQELPDALAERADWSADDLLALVEDMRTDSDLASLDTPDGLWALLDRAEVVRRVGASAATVLGWTGEDSAFTSAVSAEVVFAASSRTANEAAWTTVARPIRDVLRKRQRDALVAWLLARSGQADGDAAFEDADDLYQHYLIDVSMNPEMLTSRLKQAACSVQLFVHRVALGIELNDAATDVLAELNDDDRKQWDWMRTYRVWEAARKVFLYPENWIEPELRMDASPFFKTMQSELGQGDLTEERVTDAVLAYLERLRNIARMEVAAYYHETETVSDSETVDRLHVFARTRATPPEYYYACRDDNGIWSAWEKVDAGIEGALLLPLVYERRLLLFWVAFDAQVETENEEANTRYSMRYSWSERRGTQWTKSQTTTVVTPSGEVPKTTDTSGLAARLGTQGDALLVYLHRSNERTTATQLPLGPTILYEPEGVQVSEVPTTGITASGTISLPAGFTWEAPNFVHTFGAPLGVNYSETGTAPGPSMESWPSVDLLTDPSDDSRILVVLGHQSAFYSQRPFFLTWGTRAWLVEPVHQETQSEDVEDSDASTKGTTVSQAQESTTNDEETGALASQTYYRTSAEAVAALNGVAAIFELTEGTEGVPVGRPEYTFTKMYHPHDGTFLSAVRRDGVFALLSPDPDGPESALVLQAADGGFDFEGTLDPTSAVAQPYPVEDITFDLSAPYAIYNWELFFHLPFYVANQLVAAGKHDDAMDWFHCIFDPRVPGENGWWRVAPLATATMTAATDWFTFMGEEGSASRESFENQVSAWRDDPFDPHLVAMLRPGAYAKAVFMRYLDNLLAWGDQLFTRDTIESNNEATQLYVMAKELLGERPEELEPATKPTGKSYLELLNEGTFDAFGNVSLENYVLDSEATGTADAYAPEIAFLASTAAVTYFCVPYNDRLLSYWDTTEDRLFKLRNGMNIAGVVRSLPLYEPPIDPALLVRASAAGVDIGTVLDDLSAGIPNYRFNVMLGRAQGLANSVKALTGALLSALEKKDAEALATLRTEHESAMQDLVLAVRQSQVEDAEHGLEGARKSKKLIESKQKYFEKLVEKGWNAEEKAAARHTSNADSLQLIAGVYSLVGTVLGAFPDVYAGTLSGAKTGGEMFDRIMKGYSEGYGLGASIERAHAGRMTMTGEYKRREEGWKHELKQSGLELAQAETQIAAAEVRLEIARRELRNQERQIEHTSQVLEFMRSKWTNAELYQWMSGQLSTLAYQSYQLALATGKKAQAAYQHETGRTDTFIGSVYWDSLRKGLLAGERLAADLERMDAAYLDYDQREHELSKPVSLARLDPLALARLRTDGECYFWIPEAAFDLDSPGHYFRRLQSVALSIAAVTGQHGTVNAQLTLHGTRIRRSTTEDPEDESFNDYPSIVTSVATQDAGLFQADPKDARYLPFERRGAVSQWHLKLTAQVVKQIDWDSITDVVLHLRYTARDGGAAFAAKREAALALSSLHFGLEASVADFDDIATNAKASGAVFLLSAKRDVPDELYAAQQTPASSSLDFEVTAGMLGTLSSRTVAKILAVPVAASGSTVTGSQISLGNWTNSPASVGTVSAAVLSPPGSSPSPDTTPAGTYTVALTGGADYADLDDLVLVLVLT